LRRPHPAQATAAPHTHQHYQEASGQASAIAREIRKRPQGRGAFLVISLETSFTPELETRRDKSISGGEEKLSVSRSKFNSISGVSGPLFSPDLVISLMILKEILLTFRKRGY
jgi:hypothetical protein